MTDGQDSRSTPPSPNLPGDERPTVSRSVSEGANVYPVTRSVSEGADVYHKITKTTSEVRKTESEEREQRRTAEGTFEKKTTRSELHETHTSSSESFEPAPGRLVSGESWHEGLPPQVRVSLAGVTNTADGSLSDFDADYVLYETERNAERCRWEFEFPSHQGLHRVCVEAAPNPDGTLQLRAFLEGRTEGPAWSDSRIVDFHEAVELTRDDTSRTTSPETDWPQAVSLTPLFTAVPKEGPFYISPEPTFAEMAMMGSSSGTSCGCILKRHDSETGIFEPITDAMRNVLPGERISLLISCGSGATITDVSWTIAGKVFFSYTADEDKAKLFPNPFFSADTLVFVWANSGDNREVKLTFKVDGAPCELSEVFNVKPVYVWHGAGYNPPKLGQTGCVLRPDQYWSNLHAPGEQLLGIVFRSKVVQATGFPAGEWHYVQVVKIDLIRKWANTNSCEQDKSAKWELDTRWPYAGPWSTGFTEHQADDAPGSPLNALLLQWVTAMQFEMYIMFRPSGSGNEWVPLQKVAWEFDFCAQKQVGGLCGPAGNAWGIYSPSQSTGSWTATDVHPEWDRNLLPFDYQSVPCPGDCSDL